MTPTMAKVPLHNYSETYIRARARKLTGHAVDAPGGSYVLNKTTRLGRPLSVERTEKFLTSHS